MFHPALESHTPIVKGLPRTGGKRFQSSDRQTAHTTDPTGSASPLISIIIVVLQDCNELQRVLESVLPRKSRDVEVIVIDGGSDDGSVELLRANDSDIDYWASAPDRGLYDAMNTGIMVARGRFIYHINAGDRLVYVPTNELLHADEENADVVSFVVALDRERYFFPSAGWRLKLDNTLHHQGTFYRRSTFPGYNLKYRLFADLDVNQRLKLRGARFKLFNNIVALHSANGLSNRGSSSAELFRVVASNYGIAYVPLTWMTCKWKGLRRRLAKL